MLRTPSGYPRMLLLVVLVLELKFHRGEMVNFFAEKGIDCRGHLLRKAFK